jgi:hypothetical protein
MKGGFVVTSEEFVKAWMAAKTYREVVKATGLPIGHVYTKAAYLRKHGVKLPKINSRAGRRPLDIDALNAIIAQSNGRTESPTNQEEKP